MGPLVVGTVWPLPPFPKCPPPLQTECVGPPLSMSLAFFATSARPAQRERFQRALSAQGARLGEIEHSLAGLTEGFQALVSALQEQGLLASHEQPRPPSRAAPARTAPVQREAHSNPLPLPHQDPRLLPPTRYDGNPTRCAGFVMQCELVFASLPQVYGSDHSRITYLISLLTDRALDWATAAWESCMHSTYDDFKTRFLAVFGLPLADEQTSDKLLDIRQGDRPVADYAIEFRTLAERSGWGSPALLACFRQGLNMRIRKELAFRGEKWTLDRFIETAVALDNAARDQHTWTRQPPDRDSPSRGDPEPMQLGHGRLTPAERQRRIQGQLCLYCGTPGHLRLQCPVRPDHQVSKPAGKQ
uniref:CCHC-type domain-containing protein n=1 Tax=Scleropages formosus TaxID=113540 RepID=A0A8C9TDS6_SCLFO